MIYGIEFYGHAARCHLDQILFYKGQPCELFWRSVHAAMSQIMAIDIFFK